MYIPLESDEIPHNDVDDIVKKWIERYHRGTLRFFILHLLLHEHHRDDEFGKEIFNGYQLIQKISQMTNNHWKPSTASIYPMLNNLLQDRIIEKIDEPKESTNKRPVTHYRLTDYGKEVAQRIEEARKDLGRPFMRKSHHLPPFPFVNMKKEQMEKKLRKKDPKTLEAFKEELKFRKRKLSKLIELVDQIQAKNE